MREETKGMENSFKLWGACTTSNSRIVTSKVRLKRIWLSGKTRLEMTKYSKCWVGWINLYSLIGAHLTWNELIRANVPWRLSFASWSGTIVFHYCVLTGTPQRRSTWKFAASASGMQFSTRKPRGCALSRAEMTHVLSLGQWWSGEESLRVDRVSCEVFLNVDFLQVRFLSFALQIISNTLNLKGRTTSTRRLYCRPTS